MAKLKGKDADTMDITWDNGQTTTTQWPNNNRFKGNAQGKTFDQHVLHILQTEEGATEQHKKEIEFQLDKYERMHRFDCDCGCGNTNTEGCRYKWVWYEERPTADRNVS